jgi:hypothetical protein
MLYMKKDKFQFNVLSFICYVWRCYWHTSKSRVEGNLLSTIKTEAYWSRYVQPTFPSYFHAQKTFIKSFYNLLSHLGWISVSLWKDYQTLTTVFREHLVGFLSLKTLKATNRVYLTRSNAKNVKLAFLQWTVKRGENNST